MPPDQVSAANNRAAQQIRRARRLSASILVHGDEEYPEQVYRSNNPLPVLYVRGDSAVWSKDGFGSGRRFPIDPRAFRHPCPRVRAVCYGARPAHRVGLRRGG